jgi:PPIC-type PPIASE domain.
MMNKKTLNMLMALMVALTMLVGGLTTAMAETDVAYDPEAVFATVNGEVIKNKAIDLMFNNLAEFYMAQGVDLSSEETQQSLYSYAVQGVIQTVLVRQNAAELGVSITDEDKALAQSDFDAAIAEYEQSILATIENPTDEDKAKAHEDTLAAAAKQGFTLDYLLEDMLWNRVQEAIIKDVTVTDEEVKTNYAEAAAAEKETYANDFANYEMMSQYGPMMGMAAPIYVPAGVRGVKHILLTVPEDLTKALQDAQAVLEESLDETEAAEGAEATAAPETSEDVLKNIEDIKAQIIASVQPTIDEIMTKFEAGTSFDDLVKEYGTDPGMGAEPQMSKGYYLHLDSQMFDPAFKAAAFDQLEKVGDISGPVVGQYGVHILYYAMDVPEGAPELDAAQIESLKAEVLYEKQEAAFMEKLTAWEEAATMTFGPQQ